MKIVFLHYHLKPGGVTTVIRQQIAAVENDCEILVLSGPPPPPDLMPPHACIPGLSYDSPTKSAPAVGQTVDAIESAIRKRWDHGCDLIHVHNPLLAKNRQLLHILDLLKQRGHTLFLQVHDFAEDGRPWSYYGDRKYPADCHYGVINSRDYHLLIKSGLTEQGLHLLPNMVDSFEPMDDSRGRVTGIAAPVLYPVRAIRRKNLGEALLLSLYFPGDHPLAITLPPNSPQDWKIYKAWKAFSSDYRLNVLFEASDAYDFKTLVQTAVCLLTTSISEGFGFAFLEPWTAGKALIGRKLPAICRDFEENGIVLDHLYDSLDIPLEWIDGSSFVEKWQRCFHQVMERYRFRNDAETFGRGLKWQGRNGTIDFAMLDEPLQRQVIARVIRDAAARDALTHINPALQTAPIPSVSQERIGANRIAVLRGYGQEAYRKRLLDAYRRVKVTPVRQKIDKEMLLKEFLDPAGFSLLKWCSDDF